MLDFSRLLTKLPEDKNVAWYVQIDGAIANKSLTMKELDSLVVRLSHSCVLQRMRCHFLHELRSKIDRSKNSKYKVLFNDKDMQDLEIWKHLLHKANQGISFNLIVHRRPTKTPLSDACPCGLGRFSLLTGKAWRIKLPEYLVGKVSNNLLEYFAQIICICIGIVMGEIQPYYC